ncbi:MAG TPA: glycoside hydrolase domain-containing protein [Planctomycetota bacterium]|nr:glycoside hydrolase domain-containing protein [Planctomycetota bacterium]
MRCAGVIALGVVLALASTVAAAERTEMEAVFQQGANHYSGCKILWRSSRSCKSFDLMRDATATVVFEDLKFPGQDLRIHSAELRLIGGGEGYKRIPTADVLLFDAAGKDGGPLDVAQYRDRKIVGRKGGDPVVWKIPADLVKRWIERPETNQGLSLRLKLDQEGAFQMGFAGPGADVLSRRPALVVTCSFAGEVPPYEPEITTHLAGKTLGPQFTIHWRKKRWDPNGTPVVYEVAVLPKDGPSRTLGKADADGLACDVDTTTLPTDRPCQLQLRAVDPKGLTSEWVPADGEFRVTRRRYVVWTQNSVTKVQREEAPGPEANPVVIAAARNEYESFQVVMGALSNLKDVDVKVNDLIGRGGARIGADNVKLYRVHYVDCGGQGRLPDSMVPLVNPKTGKRIGGEFGVPFDVPGGTHASVWAELHVPADATPGDYKSSVDVTVGGVPAAGIPVALTVWPVTLPKETTLLTYFALRWDTPQRDYLQSIHAHRMDVWYVYGVGNSLEKQGDDVVVKWNPDYEKTLDDYFSGELFPDGVPGKTHLLGKPSWEVWLGLRSGKTRVSILKQYEARYKDKPWIGRCAWFFIDEPGRGQMKWCQDSGRDVKQYSPSIRFLLTTHYNKDLVGLVDVWDAIINREVIDWDAPGPEPYRDETAKGRTVINCVTVNSNTPTSPNTFIHHRAMNTRIWPWVTYALDQKGIELWETKPAPSVALPRKFGTVWGDGSLFYRGLPEELEIPEEIALPSIRLKILRDGIEDFELLSMLAKKDPDLAKKLCHRMVQETKDYDKSFALPVQHMSWNWNRDGKGDRQVPGFVIWESSAERLAETRAAIAKALAD